MLFSSTENIVFSNVTAQVPELYAKNPIVSVSATPTLSKQIDETVDAFARALQKLINVLFAMKVSPGVNIKPKAKRNVLIALLTNRHGSRLAIRRRTRAASKRCKTCWHCLRSWLRQQDDQEIREIEGKLRHWRRRLSSCSPVVHSFVYVCLIR